MKKRAIFLDRDGVINREVSYLSNPENMELLPNVGQALDYMHNLGFLAVVTTNQSGVARKMYSAKDTELVHARIQRELLCSGHSTIDGFYCCFHHPEYNGPCNCRKPQPGMLLTAARELQIDLSKSIMIGDRFSDLIAGVAAGCQNSILVLTGYGNNDKDKVLAAGLPIADDLFAGIKLFF